MNIKEVKLNNNQPFVYLSKDDFKEGDRVEVRKYMKKTQKEVIEWIHENKEKIQKARDEIKILISGKTTLPDYQVLEFIQKSLEIKTDFSGEDYIFSKGKVFIESDYFHNIVDADNFYNPNYAFNDDLMFLKEERSMYEEIGTYFKFNKSHIDSQNLKDSIDIYFFYNMWCSFYKEFENNIENIFRDLDFTEFEHDEFTTDIKHKELPIVITVSNFYEEREKFYFNYIDYETNQYIVMTEEIINKIPRNKTYVV